MRVKAAFHHVIEVVREVEVSPEALAAWRERLEDRGQMPNDEQVIEDLLETDEDNLLRETFEDWRTSEPLPPDFEFHHTDIAGVEVLT